MPKVIHYRVWCKTCADFSLHSESPKTCNKCKTEYTSVLLSDIPVEKRLEQQDRFAQKRHQDLFKMLRSANILEELFSSTMSVEIYESDAGLQAIETRQKEAQRQKIAQLKEEAAQFNLLGRNDPCACASGKKFKKCCITKYQYF